MPTTSAIRTWLTGVALLALPLTVACNADDSDENPFGDDTDGPQGSVCGTPEYGIELFMTGRVTDGNGRGTGGASVKLYDYAEQPPAVLGEGLTDSSGTFGFQATDITSIPDCWLTLLDYQMEATLGTKTESEQVNMDMWNAIQSSESMVDVGDIAIP